MKTKKWLLLALCLLLTLAFVPAAARAEEYSGKCGDDLYWSFDKSTGKLTITGTGYMDDWSMYSGRSPSDTPWDAYRNQITSIKLPAGLTIIGGNAFCGTKITSIIIPDSVTAIGDNAFANCTGLASITIPVNVSYLHDHAFYNCTGLTSLTIPDSVRCEGGTDIRNAFSGCTGIKTVHISDGPGNWQVTQSVLPLEASNVSVTVAEGIRDIGQEAFSGCTGLTSITIPNSVTSIGYGAFSRCTGLTSITIPNSVTSIGYGAFSGCTGLTSITIPNSVTSIGDGAFSCCTGLTSVTIPKNVTYISAFGGCTGLTSVTIPSSVTSIGDHAFYNCTGLKTVKYGGTQAQKAQMSIGEYNEPLLNATWQCAINISFNANGGSVSPATKVVQYGQAYGTMPTPTRSGYTFDGWYTAKTGGKKVTASTVCYATGDYTLYARWTSVRTYTVTLNPNGGTCGTGSKTVTYGQAYGTLPVPTRKGYTFAGWWTAKTGGKKVTASTICYASGNYTLYARWTEGYTMTFNPNGGTVSPTTKVVKYGQQYGSLPTPTRAGYTFAGWWTTKADGGKKVVSTTVCYASAGYTLYARWTAKKFVITLNPNGGSCTAGSKTVTYGKQYGALPEPTRSGYVFAGWWTTRDTGGKQVFSSTTCYATGSYTLYARWTKN